MTQAQCGVLLALGCEAGREEPEDAKGDLHLYEGEREPRAYFASAPSSAPPTTPSAVSGRVVHAARRRISPSLARGGGATVPCSTASDTDRRRADSELDPPFTEGPTERPPHPAHFFKDGPLSPTATPLARPPSLRAAPWTHPRRAGAGGREGVLPRAPDARAG